MQDYLVEIGQFGPAKKVAKNLGIPVPQRLERAEGPIGAEPLKDKKIVLGGSGHLQKKIAEVTILAGGQFHVLSKQGALPAEFDGMMDVKPVAGLDDGPAADGLVFDATAIVHPRDLKDMYTFYHRRIRQLRPNGRVVVLGPALDQKNDVAAHSAAAALTGFVRSLAKEVGRKGATAQLITVAADPEAQQRAMGTLVFMLSARSAFISGQVIRVDSLVKSKTHLQFAGSLKGKVALVTGAARGIGAATAVALAAEGAQVVCLDRPDDEKLLAEVALEVGGKMLLQDITAEGASDDIAEFLKTHCKGVDIIVHNAGITRDKTLANMDDDRWDLTIDVNLTAIMEITEKLLKKGLRDGGKIICLSSIAGIAGNFGQTNYSASKSGVIGYVEAMAVKLAARGINVNAVAPGFIETRLTAAIPFITREAARRMSNVSQGGLPADIANAITFLASPSATGVSGEVLRVCGGSLVGA